MFLTSYKGKILCICFVLVLTASGCDLISSVKDYFQESSDVPAVQPSAVPKNTPIQIQPMESGPMGPNVLARVGSWSITIEEFEERLTALKEVVPEYDTTEPGARKMVLDELINQQILVVGAETAGLNRQKDIQAAVEEFRRTLIVREVAQQLTQDIKTTEEEALTFYEENKDVMVAPAQWHVRELVVATKEQATDILAQVLQGADFSEMAKQYSVGETANEGGDLGFITQEPFPQMGSALLSLEEGDVSSVFKGPEGFYFVKLEEKKDGEPIDFSEIKEEIIQSQTLLMQQQAILDHLNRLKATIKVEINEKLVP